MPTYHLHFVECDFENSIYIFFGKNISQYTINFIFNRFIYPQINYKSWGEKEIEESYRRLQEAYEELKELDRMKNELISNVSHELRTPITIAKNAIELAMDEEVAEERNKFLAMGRGALARLNLIVGDLLDIAKFQKGL